MGWSGLHRSAGETNVTLPSVDQTATLTTPSVSAPNLNTPTGSLPGLSFAPLSIVRSGNGFTLTGDLPDLNAKNALLDTLRGTFGADVNLTDNLNIKAGVSAPDFTGLGGLFKAAVDIPDFNFDLNGDTLTLTGTAPSEDAKSAVETRGRRPGRTSRWSTTFRYRRRPHRQPHRHRELGRVPACRQTSQV